MKILAYVIASFYSLGCFGICFEVSSRYSTEEHIHSEPIQTSLDENLNQTALKAYVEDLLKPKFLISDPLFEDLSKNASFVEKNNRKREVPLGDGLNYEVKMKILQLHNLYRSNVTPPAGNMAYMEWDEELARLAQIWSENCVFDHGMPENNYTDTIGQNLYIGTDSTGYLGLYLWYEEYHDYDLRTDECLPNKQCGHFIQMGWPESNKLGCGLKKCGMRYLLTCHYSPTAVKGIMYEVAKPCSQCPHPGTLCLKNLCMTEEQCKNNPFDCQYAKCELDCLNCGRLNKGKCSCECTDGWDSPDCSYLCKNKHEKCGKNPGFKDKAYCSIKNQVVAKKLCREMCDMCQKVNTSASDNICCGGKLCDDGYILDSSCKCILLCPGPLCDGKAGGQLQAALESSANYLNKLPCISQWMIILFLLYFRVMKL